MRFNRKGSNPSYPVLKISDLEKIKTEVREKAIEKARKKALRTAKVSGFKIGRIIPINDGDAYHPYYNYNEYSSYDSMAPDEITSGKITTQVTVSSTKFFKKASRL